MLIEFNIENFLSIREQATLSLLASIDKSLEDNLIKINGVNKDSLLRSAVIYGANASGKTNVLYAFAVLRRFIITSHNNQKGDKLEYHPFKLDSTSKRKPTKFKIVFIKKSVKYLYEISYNDEKIIDECLYSFPKGRKSTIFERFNTNGYKFTSDIERQKGLSKQTLDNVSYLSRSTQLNYEKTSDAFEWFKNDLKVIGPTDQLDPEDTIKIMNTEKNLAKLILNALIEADLGIDHITAKVRNVSTKDLPTELKKIKEILGEKIGKKIGREFVIKFYHKLPDNKTIPFSIEEESVGTQRLFSLIGPWIDALINGRILVVDELDTKLHHFLNIFLVKLFHDSTQNKKNAQLIFTTHNTNLLDQDLLRRDQVWFTEKNPKTNGTDLYSLSEFSPRKDKNLQKGYLAGRYGALPFIKENKICTNAFLKIIK